MISQDGTMFSFHAKSSGHTVKNSIETNGIVHYGTVSVSRRELSNKNHIQWIITASNYLLFKVLLSDYVNIYSQSWSGVFCVVIIFRLLYIFDEMENRMIEGV